MLTTEEFAGGKVVVLLRLGLLVGLYPTLNSLAAGLMCRDTVVFDSRKESRVQGLALEIYLICGKVVVYYLFDEGMWVTRDHHLQQHIQQHIFQF